MRLLVTHFALILFLSPVIQNTYGDNVKSMQSALVFLIFMHNPQFAIFLEIQRVWSSCPQLGDLGRFLGSKWDRQLKFSAYAFFFDFVKPLQIWAYLDNSFFHSFQRKNAEKLPIGFSPFFLWLPLGNYEKKVV